MAITPKKMTVDFHTHILPRIDDGSRSVQMSLEMLKKEQSDGVDKIVLTPHMYLSEQNVQSFFNKRQASYEQLKASYSGQIQLFLGAEVYFSPTLSEIDLTPLCISGTDYMLLELPYHQFDTAVMNSVRSFINSCDKKIILAHIERYLQFADEKTLFELINMDVACQVNCHSLSGGLFSKTRKFTQNLIESGTAKAIGTDAHNTDSRPPEFDIAHRRISHSALDTLMKNSEKILANAPLSKLF